MASNKKGSKKILEYLIWGVVCVVLAFILSGIIGVIVSGEDFTLGLMFSKIFDGSSIIYAVIILAVVGLFLLLQNPKKDGGKIKWKTKDS